MCSSGDSSASLAWKGNQDFLTWIAEFEIVLQRLRNSWMDPLPEVALEDDNQEFLAALGRDPTFASLREPAEQAAYAATHSPQWNQERTDAHRKSFPLNDNLLSLLFLVQSDLNETQRERLVSALTNQGYRIETYWYMVVRQTMFDQVATTRTGLQDPNIRHSSHKQDRHP